MNLNTKILIGILAILLMFAGYFAISKAKFDHGHRDTIKTNPDDDGGLFQ